jgi:hypothetical protein
MFSGFRMYFFWVTFHFSDHSSVHVALLFVFFACGVMFVVVSVLYCLFCSSICCLCGDLNVLLGFDLAMFVDLKKICASFGGWFGLVTCCGKSK